MTWTLTGDHATDLRLTWTINHDARQHLEDEIFGKRVLVTNRDTRPIADVVAAYRSPSDAEFGFRQLKDPHAAFEVDQSGRGELHHVVQRVEPPGRAVDQGEER